MTCTRWAGLQVDRNASRAVKFIEAFMALAFSLELQPFSDELLRFGLSVSSVIAYQAICAHENVSSVSEDKILTRRGDAKWLGLSWIPMMIDWPVWDYIEGQLMEGFLVFAFSIQSESELFQTSEPSIDSSFARRWCEDMFSLEIRLIFTTRCDDRWLLKFLVLQFKII